MKILFHQRRFTEFRIITPIKNAIDGELYIYVHIGSKAWKTDLLSAFLTPSIIFIPKRLISRKEADPLPRALTVRTHEAVSHLRFHSIAKAGVNRGERQYWYCCSYCYWHCHWNSRWPRYWYYYAANAATQ